MAKARKEPGNRGNTEKAGAHRVAFDHAAALEALAWAQGGVQLDLPGVGVARFVGVAPLPDDGEARAPGRPPGAKNLVPQAFREYLVARYGSAVEGLAQEATRPLVAIVAELAQAWIIANRAFGRKLEPTAAQISEWVTFAKGLQLQARRYVAPYQHTQAPQPLAAPPSPVRIGVAVFTGGQPAPAQLAAAETTLAGLMGIERNQRVTDVEVVELNAGELNAGEDDAV